jgi:hypothetical protein
MRHTHKRIWQHRDGGGCIDAFTSSFLGFFAWNPFRSDAGEGICPKTCMSERSMQELVRRSIYTHVFKLSLIHTIKDSQENGQVTPPQIPHLRSAGRGSLHRSNLIWFVHNLSAETVKYIFFKSLRKNSCASGADNGPTSVFFTKEKLKFQITHSEIGENTRQGS